MEYTQMEQSLQAAIEKHDFRFDPDDWSAMEAMLDEKKKRRSFIFWLLGVGSLCLLCVLGILIGGKETKDSAGTFAAAQMNKSEIDQKSTEAMASSVFGTVSENKSSSDSEGRAIGTSTLSIAPTALTTNGGLKESDSKSAEGFAILPSTDQETDVPQENLTTNVHGGGSILQPNNVALSTQNHFVSGLVAEDNKSSVDIVQTVKAESIEYTKGLPIDSANEEGIVEQARITGLEALPLLDPVLYFVIELPQLEDKNVEEPKLGFSKFVVSASVGLETSKTPQGALSEPDINLGLKLCYFISRKLGITVGANYVKDVYKTERGEYKSYPGFWKAAGAPDRTMANCDMLELALGISYHFSDVESKGLITHININSNFMLNEQYMYLYDEPGKDWSASWQNDFNTYLSSVDFSCGYKFATKQSLLFEAGPYAKLPINGIGHGGIKLTSFGLKMSVSLVK